MILILSLAILVMWFYMLKVNQFKASEIQKHSDTLEFQSAENQDDPGTEGARLLDEHIKAALTGLDRDAEARAAAEEQAAGERVATERAAAELRATCVGLNFEQLVVHRDNPMFLNCMLKDDLKITNLNERLKLIDVISRCKTPLEWLIIDEGACKGKGTCYDWFGMA